MDTLEALIRDAATRGEIDHLTLAPTKDGRWQASLRQVGSAGYRVMLDDDPVDALKAAMGLKVEKAALEDLLG